MTTPPSWREKVMVIITSIELTFVNQIIIIIFVV